MLIRSVLFNFQGAFLTSRSWRLDYYITFGTVCQVVFQKFLKKFWKHLPKVITLSGWRRHPDLNWGSGCCRPMPYHLAIAPKLERITRLELATSTLARWRSTRWAKSAYWCLRSESNQRHGDFQSPALPTELQRQQWRPGWDSNPRPPPWQGGVLTNWTTRPYGGSYRARTYDPLLVRQMLSQLS